jgi:hypothetical protein
MLISVVIDPKAFDRSCFSTPGYREHAEILFRGLESNGVLIADADSRLLKEIGEQLGSLSTKDGQQLQIWFAELMKKRNRRLIIVDATTCNTRHCASSHEIACTVRARCSADAVILDQPTFDQLEAKRIPTQWFTPLSQYISSPLELERRRFMERLPFIDQLKQEDFEQLIVRSTRYSKHLRFYDKQIGKGESLSRFRAGIERIVELWVQNAHYPRRALKAELFTSVQKTHRDESAVHARILDGLMRPLRNKFRIPFALYWKEDSAHLTHDRYLQTDNVSISFSKGFDYLDGGNLQRCKLQIDNGCDAHLLEYRNLLDRRPPA